MPVTDDLFGPLPAPETVSRDRAARRTAGPPRSAFLVTNYPNMMYMLAAGLIMPPAGFGGKHYRDPLASFPGWIPLFVRKVPEAALRLATEEARHLKPVVAAVRLNGLSGTVRAIGAGGVREIRFPDEFDRTGSALLIPAPLPVSCIETLLFPSPDERKAFADAALDFGNVPVQAFKRGTRKLLFARTSDDHWPPAQAVRERDVPLRVPLAAGGVMAMLLRVACKGELAIHACRQAFDPDGPAKPDGPGELDDPGEIDPPGDEGCGGAPDDPGEPDGPGNPDGARNSGDLGDSSDRGGLDVPDTHTVRGAGPLAGDPILAGLSDWMRTGTASAPPAPDKGANREQLRWTFQRQLFWELTGHLLQQENDRQSSAEDILLEYLDHASGTLNPRLRSGAAGLLRSLRSLAGLDGASAGELFERHQSPFARATILFFLRRTCRDLLEFNHDGLREADWLAAAVLFGVRDGWLGLPVDLRMVPGLARGELQAAVSYRMAQLAHRMAGTDLNLGTCPPRVRPLCELLGGSNAWRSRERAAALELSRALKWDCIRTRVRLPKGEYRLTARGGSVQIDVTGEPRITSRIDRGQFFDYLGNTRLDSRTEARIRKLLR